MWVLGTKFGSSSRVVYIFYCWAISPALFSVCVSLCVGFCMGLCTWKQLITEARGIGSLWSFSYRELWAHWCWCWEPNIGPLKEQCTLINSWAISLAPGFVICKHCWLVYPKVAYISLLARMSISWFSAEYFECDQHFNLTWGPLNYEYIVVFWLMTGVDVF